MKSFLPRYPYPFQDDFELVSEVVTMCVPKFQRLLKSCATHFKQSFDLLIPRQSKALEFPVKVVYIRTEKAVTGESWENISLRTSTERICILSSRSPRKNILFQLKVLIKTVQW